MSGPAKRYLCDVAGTTDTVPMEVIKNCYVVTAADYDELRQAVRELLGVGAELTADSSPREAVTEIRRTQDVLERLRQLVGEQP